MDTIDTALPCDRDAMTRLALSRREHLDHAIALRLFARMKRRPVLFARPVPQGVRDQIAAHLHCEQLALGMAVYVDATGRRRICVARAAQAWRALNWPTDRMLSEPPTPTLRRLVEVRILLPGPPSDARFPDLHF